MNILYFDCLAGVSADMVVGALLDMGLSAKMLARELSKVELGAVYDIESEKVEKNGVWATAFSVSVRSAPQWYSTQYLVSQVLDSGLEHHVKELAVRILECYIRAEKTVFKGTSEEDALDGISAVETLVGFLSAAIGISYMGADVIVSSPLTEGSGVVQTKHGLMRVPVPMVMECLRTAGAPIQICTERTQLITPSGAAIVCALSESFDELPSMTVRGIGFGAGRKDLDTRANVLRLVLGQNEESFFPKSICPMPKRELWQSDTAHAFRE